MVLCNLNMELAKLNTDGILDLRCCNPNEVKRFKMLKEEGFLEFVPSEIPPVDLYSMAKDSYTILDGKIYQKWVISPNNKIIINEISALKSKLSATDYQVTKCMEAQLIGNPLPYDIEVLHSERQKIRDRINELEILINANNENRL